MELSDIYNLLEAHLGNCTDYALKEESMRKSRVKLPIPPEYGGGWATGETMVDAVRALIERLSLKVKKDSPLFSECADKWIEIKKGEKKSPSTVKGYETILRLHLKPFFEGKKINDITADDIQLYFNSIMELSKSQSTQSKAILDAVFERADRNGWLERNPMLFKYEMSSKEGEKVVLQDQDLIRVIGQIDELLKSGDNRDYLYFCFLCFTALRRGEILGLRWGDIDFKNDELNVVNNVTFPNGENNYVIRQPKDGSFGVNHLHSILKEKIQRFAGKKDEYVIPDLSDKTKPVTRSMFVKIWRRINQVIDLKGASSHSFRSSYATMMNAHCEHIDPKALQGALRHKTPGLALKVYTKKNESKTRLAEKEYDSWLRGQLEE